MNAKISKKVMSVLERENANFAQGCMGYCLSRRIQTV